MNMGGVCLFKSNQKVEHRVQKGFVVFGFLALQSLHSYSAEQDQGLVGQFKIAASNDIWFGSDDNYTAGLLLEWSPKGSSYTWRLGQDIYTPSDISTPEPIVGEHPYAAWAYLGIQRKLQVFDNWMFKLTLDGGSAGPRAGGKEIQREFHDTKIRMAGKAKYSMNGEPWVSFKFLTEYHCFHTEKYYELSLT